MLLLYLEDTDMVQLLIALFTLVLAIPASAQTTVTVETTSYVSIVKVTDNSFVEMCQNFQKKIGHDSASDIVIFRPKVMPIGQDEKSGSIWLINTTGRSIEIAGSELPAPLRKLRGAVVRNILQASCYTQDMMFFNRRDVVMTTVDSTDANAVAQALR